MLTETVITVLTETVFGHLIEESGVRDKVRCYLKRCGTWLQCRVPDNQVRGTKLYKANIIAL